MSMLQEIRRRKVFQVAAVYSVVAWLVIQVVDVVNEPLNLPGWLDTVVIVLLGVGFPIAVILAWAFDLTPEGIRSASDAATTDSRPLPSAGRLGAVSQVLVLVAVVFLVADEYLFDTVPRVNDPGPDIGNDRVVRFALELPPGERLGVDDQSLSLAISPDGRRAVFATAEGPNLYSWHVRDLGEFGSIPLRGTDIRYETPTFSPDGEWVAFNDLNVGTLVRVPVLGGNPIRIAEVISALRGADWGDDGTIVFGTQEDGLWQVSGAGGEPAQLTVPDIGTQHRWPDWLPGQNAILFTVSTDRHRQVAVLDRETGETSILIAEGTSPRYLRTGHIAYAVSDGTLRVVAFDPEALTVSGQAVTVLGDLPVGNSGGAHYSVADGGTMMHAADLPITDVVRGGRRARAVWVDEQGEEQAAGVDECRCFEPSLSPDGTRLALSVIDDAGQTAAIRVWSFERNMFVRLTFEDRSQFSPVWSPDSRQIAYGAAGEGIRVRAADGSGSSRLVVDDPTAIPFGWLPEVGILYNVGPNSARAQNFVILADPGAVQEPVPVGDAGMNRPSVSPDKRWIAYESSGSSRPEIFVQPFPDLDSGRWQVSTDAGVEPRWSADGSRLYFKNFGRLMAVSVDDADTFRFGRPEPVAELGDYLSSSGRTYAVSPGGRKLLFLKIADPLPSEEGQPAGGRIVVVLNWVEEVRRMQP